jgi:hypothetical protein
MALRDNFKNVTFELLPSTILLVATCREKFVVRMSIMYVKLILHFPGSYHHSLMEF